MANRELTRDIIKEYMAVAEALHNVMNQVRQLFDRENDEQIDWAALPGGFVDGTDQTILNPPGESDGQGGFTGGTRTVSQLDDFQQAEKTLKTLVSLYHNYGKDNVNMADPNPPTTGRYIKVVGGDPSKNIRSIKQKVVS